MHTVASSTTRVPVPSIQALKLDFPAQRAPPKAALRLSRVRSRNEAVSAGSSGVQAVFDPPPTQLGHSAVGGNCG